MLKKPYKLIHTIDSNNYYILEVDKALYLTVETVARYGRKQRKELTTALKQFPLTSFNIRLFNKVLELKDLGDGNDDGLEYEPNFESFDLRRLRSDLHELIGKDSPILFNKSTSNEALMKFIGEGNGMYCVVDGGRYSRTHWLARTDKFGNVRIYEVLMYDKPSQEKIIDMNMYVFDRDTMTKAIEYVMKKYKIKEESDIE